MKKSVLSLAVPWQPSPPRRAQAQSNVTGVWLARRRRRSPNHANAGRTPSPSVISGGKNTSRWGFRGTEDLGGGLKAVYNLEGGILMDTGAADGAMFKRQAYVGLEGRFGRVVIGRSFTTTYDTVIRSIRWATRRTTRGRLRATRPARRKYGMTTAFDNLVKYSGSTGDFKYGATVGMGEQAGNAATAANMRSPALWNHDGMGLMATYEQVNGNTVVATGNRDETTAYHLGAFFKTGDWRLTAGLRATNWRRARPPPPTCAPTPTGAA
jgi:predicted porin